MALTGFTLNGLDLRTLAHNIDSVNGWDSFPGVKSAGVEYAFTHGEYLGGRRFYRAREIDLNMVILTTDSTGVVTTSPEEHLEENVDTLLGALHNSFGPITLTRTMPSGAVRTAAVRPIDFVRFGSFQGPLLRAATLTLRMGYPFWHGAADSYTGGTGTVTNDGNAPVNDMVITFTTAGRITHDDTGDYIESDSAGLVVDVGTGVITGGDSGEIHSNNPWFLQLEPGDNDITVTGGNKTINFFPGYF